MKWNASRFKRNVLESAEKRVLDVCVSAKQEAIDNMKRLPGNAHSKPGDWPAIQTEWLLQHITYEIERTEDGVEGRFGLIPSQSSGEELGYGYYLEVGVPGHMKPRPWLTLTMDALEREYGLTFERTL